MKSLPVVLTVLVGCSYGMRTLPARPTVGVAYDCETSRGKPILDTIVAATVGVLYTAASIGYTVQCARGETHGCSTIGLLYVPSIWGIASIPAARRGYKEAARCRAYYAGTLPLVPAPPAPPAPRAEEVDRADTARGKACERIPGALHGGICPRGLVCRGDVCVP